MNTNGYHNLDGWLVLDREASLAREARNLPQSSYSPAAQDWLFCQQFVNRILGSLVNGESRFSRRRPRDWIYRFAVGRPEWWRGGSHCNCSGPYSSKLAIHCGNGQLNCRGVYDLLRVCDDVLASPPSEITTTPITVNVGGARASVGEEHPVIASLRSQLRPVADVISAYVHGSIALGDYTKFSDVDDWVVVHRTAWQSYDRFRAAAAHLERAGKLFQRVDPLQHHGHWVFSDLDLACLDQSTMPLVVLNEAVVVAGKESIAAEVRAAPACVNRILWYIVQETRRDMTALAAGTLNLFGLKNLISGISLLPPLAFQVGGVMLDKKSSIERCHEIFTDEAVQAIHWATKLRENWASCPGYGWVAAMKGVNRLLPFRRCAEEWIARRFSPPARHVPFFDARIERSAFVLTEECTARLEAARTVA